MRSLSPAPAAVTAAASAPPPPETGMVAPGDGSGNDVVRLSRNGLAGGTTAFPRKPLYFFDVKLSCGRLAAANPQLPLLRTNRASFGSPSWKNETTTGVPGGGPSAAMARSTDASWATRARAARTAARARTLLRCITRSSPDGLVVPRQEERVGERALLGDDERHVAAAQRGRHGHRRLGVALDLAGRREILLVHDGAGRVRLAEADGPLAAVRADPVGEDQLEAFRHRERPVGAHDLFARVSRADGLTVEDALSARVGIRCCHRCPLKS